MIPFIIAGIAGYAIYAIKKCNSDDNKVYTKESETGNKSSKGDVEQAGYDTLKGFGNNKFINK